MTTSVYKPEIVVVDDHEVVLDGLIRILSGIDAVGEIHAARDGEDALRIVATNKRIALVITDLEMPLMGGLTLLTKIRNSHPHVRVLVLTMHNSAALIREVLKLNADGYVVKSADRTELELAVRSILAGKRYVHHSVAEQLAAEASDRVGNDPLEVLTEREREVMALIAQGFSNKDIADKLFISVKTVDSHRTNLMQKLDIHNIAGLTRLAIQAKLI